LFSVGGAVAFFLRGFPNQPSCATRGWVWVDWVKECQPWINNHMGLSEKGNIPSSEPFEEGQL